MILAGFLGMSTKMAECTLGVKYRHEHADGTVSGGPTYYLRDGVGKLVNPTLGKEIDKFVTYDVNYRVELPWDMRLIASVENLTDEEPPFVRLELAYDPFTANALGRIYKLGLTMHFGGE